ncbi:DinB family protein [Botryobacter ruber]|uniref:DinB family protein n=1 Tax=Botryobacter ruber TaxID=2171629 RepID=UPI000E0C8484|nr:DinB family protein [Botryobacter ruber]
MQEQTTFQQNTDALVREQLVELLKGGFAPTVILLREFQFEKAGYVLDGLHFSAWVLLGHMRARQQTLLQFMKDPENNPDIWPDAHWPENHTPQSDQEWQQAISQFEQELEEMIQLVQHPETQLFRVQSNGKTISWAAMTTLHHNAYHIGQLKTIGRQLGVW